MSEPAGAKVDSRTVNEQLFKARNRTNGGTASQEIWRRLVPYASSFRPCIFLALRQNQNPAVIADFPLEGTIKL